MRFFMIALLWCCTAITTLGQEPPQKFELLFSVQSTDLEPEHMTVLNELVNSLNFYKDYKIIISGHADGEGSFLRNERISEKRAMTVKDYLMGQRVLGSKMEVVAFGETLPKMSNATAETRKYNRRVEISVYYQIHKEEIKKNIVKTPVEKLYDRLEMKPQTFCVNPARDTCIRGKGGTLVYIKANSFDLSNVFMTPKCIEIELKEIDKNAQVILENLSTTSNGQLIQTQGMTHISARIEEEELRLVRGKDLVVMMPSETLHPGTKPYDGNWFKTDNTINWTVNNSGQMGSFTLKDFNQCVLSMLENRIENGDRIFLGKSRYSKTELSRDYLIGEPEESCKRFVKILKQYNIPNLQVLADAVNQPMYQLFDTKELTKLQEAITEEKAKATDIETRLDDGEKVVLPVVLLKNMKINYRAKLAEYEALKYYTYNVTRLGWSTLKVKSLFRNLAEKSIRVNLKPDEHIDAKIISKKYGFVMGGSPKNDHYMFDDVPVGDKMWIIALKYEDRIPHMAIQPITEDEEQYELVFFPYQQNAISDVLKMLN